MSRLWVIETTMKLFLVSGIGKLPSSDVRIRKFPGLEFLIGYRYPPIFLIFVILSSTARCKANSVLCAARGVGAGLARWAPCDDLWTRYKSALEIKSRGVLRASAPARDTLRNFENDPILVMTFVITVGAVAVTPTAVPLLHSQMLLSHWDIQLNLLWRQN